jgi:hypothetical protein
VITSLRDKASPGILEDLEFDARNIVPILLAGEALSGSGKPCLS